MGFYHSEVLKPVRKSFLAESSSKNQVFINKADYMQPIWYKDQYSKLFMAKILFSYSKGLSSLLKRKG